MQPIKNINLLINILKLKSQHGFKILIEIKAQIAEYTNIQMKVRKIS